MSRIPPPRKPRPARAALAEIRRLYETTTAATVQRDLASAIRLFRSLPDPDREKAAVFMDGLAQMRTEWNVRSSGTRKR